MIRAEAFVYGKRVIMGLNRDDLKPRICLFSQSGDNGFGWEGYGKWTWVE